MLPSGCSPFTLRRTAIRPLIAVLGCALVVGVLGCRSRAHSDLYRQRMASEIRVLEDQLYDADYQNRVLRDKVERLQQESLSKTSPERRARPETAPSRDNASSPATPESDYFDDSDFGGDFDVPFVEEGVPVDSPNLPGMEPPGGESEGVGAQDAGSLDTELIPPAAPEPPGKEDLEMPEIVPGEMLPPNQGNQEEKPAGQIQLPDSVQASTPRPPKTIRIHRGLSGGHQFDEDDQIDGMYLVINAVDALGKTVDLADFEIEAELSVVVLDPTLESPEARIGRWDFDPAQVREFIRGNPTSGLFVPIPWSEDRKPESDEVIVHVRLRADEDEMRCQDNLKVGAAAAMAKWTPRGD